MASDDDKKIILLPNAELTYARLDVNKTVRIIQDMGPEHAAAMIEIARAQHVIPEQERTRRSRQQTFRQGLTVFGVVACVAIVAFGGGPTAVAVAGVTVLGGGVVFSEFFNREKKPKTEAPPNKA